MSEEVAVAGECATDSDADFDPTAEMLVDEADDERTIEEEEADESADAGELDDLQREGEMPLEELLAMYGCGEKEPVEPRPHSSPRTLLNQVSHSNNESDSSPEDKLDDSPPTLPLSSSRPLLRSVHQASESSDSGTDSDYSPDEDWRKTIQVGSAYQAVVPDGLSPYDGAPAYENEDRLLWDPTQLPDEQVEDYLRQSRLPKTANATDVSQLPTGRHVRDDEQALFLLLQCGHNLEEALRRRRMQPLPPPESMSLWSEDECRSFETGIKAYGKHFHVIQTNKVRTRAVSELVHFYYLWKKTERHDMFVSKNRVEKKKYNLHPGTTDFMDRFLEEQESLLSAQHRSPSPAPDLKKTPPTSPDSSTPSNRDALDCLSSTSTGTEAEGGALLKGGGTGTGTTSDCSRDCLSGDDENATSTTTTNEDRNFVCLN